LLITINPEACKYRKTVNREMFIMVR